MNEYTVTICRARNLKPETAEAICEMVKAAIEHLEEIEMKRGKCKSCNQSKEIMPRLEVCSDCYLAKYNFHNHRRQTAPEASNVIGFVKPKQQPEPPLERGKYV